MTFHLADGYGRYHDSGVRMTEVWETLVPQDVLEGVLVIYLKSSSPVHLHTYQVKTPNSYLNFREIAKTLGFQVLS